MRQACTISTTCFSVTHRLNGHAASPDSNWQFPAYVQILRESAIFARQKQARTLVHAERVLHSPISQRIWGLALYPDICNRHGRERPFKAHYFRAWRIA